MLKHVEGAAACGNGSTLAHGQSSSPASVTALIAISTHMYGPHPEGRDSDAREEQVGCQSQLFKIPNKRPVVAVSAT